MRIEITRVVDVHGDGLVHACWPHQQTTFCGKSKVNWPYPTNWRDPIGCVLCRARVLDEGIEALQEYIGYPVSQEQVA
jgi:hypothetical protein